MNNPFSEIRFRSGAQPGVRYVSGSTVFDEMFAGGRLLSRYWNPNGQVWPEMHYANLRWGIDQPADTFQLSINGRNLAGGYTWEAASIEPDPSAYRARVDASGKALPVTHSVVRLLHKEAGIEVKVHTRLDGSPYIIRWLEITNLNSTAVGISAVAPFAGMLWSHRYEEHLPPGAESPFELGYTHMFEALREGDFWFEPLADGLKKVNGDKKGRSGWGRPAFWARNRCNGQTFVCELAWGGNYEFGLDCRLKETAWDWNRLQPGMRNSELYFSMGLSGYDEALRVLDAGENLKTPAVHLALFHSDFERIVQASHDHVRHVVMPAPVPGRYVEIEANHRGYLCDRENVPDILKDIDVAASLGIEMYVIDAGWYGNEPNEWGNNVGDWYDGPWMLKPPAGGPETPGGLRTVADHAHQRGMKFGLWVEIEAAGEKSKLKKEHPDWLLKRDGKPIQGGRALDLTQPVVAAWVESEITRLIQTYQLDMYRLDHNHPLQPAGNRVYQGFTEDLTWRYYEALYAAFEHVKAKFPEVVLQNCAGGGGRLDWGTLARFNNTELSDWMRMPRGLRLLNGVSVSLPPEILLRTFGTEVPEHVLDGNVDTQLRLCFSRIIFRGIAPSLEELTPYLRERVEHYLAIYKDVIRPVMVEGRVYHHTPALSHAKQAPWCVLEYARPDRSAAVAAVFRTSSMTTGAEEGSYIFKPRGLDPERQYHVTLDNQGLEYLASGKELARDGIQVRLEAALTSELILFKE
jgi:alpha-galactosidase